MMAEQSKQQQHASGSGGPDDGDDDAHGSPPQEGEAEDGADRSSVDAPTPSSSAQPSPQHGRVKGKPAPHDASPQRRGKNNAPTAASKAQKGSQPPRRRPPTGDDDDDDEPEDEEEEAPEDEEEGDEDDAGAEEEAESEDVDDTPKNKKPSKQEPRGAPSTHPQQQQQGNKKQPSAAAAPKARGQQPPHPSRPVANSTSPSQHHPDDADPPAADHANDADEDAAEGQDGSSIVVGTFDVDRLPDWERDVYYAIHDELGQESQSTPAESVDHLEGITELNHHFGYYCTACLFSRRWKLREAALKVVASFFTLYFNRHGQPTASMTALLKYFDVRGFGLLDPISQVYFATCDILVRLVEGRVDDVPLSSVQIHVVALLPRILLRASDSTPKTRDESLSLLFLLASSTIGPEKVALAVLADPVDHNKRRIPATNHRVSAARLTVMHHLIHNHRIGGRLAVDALMTKLVLPCLNSSGNEVRDLAVAVVAGLDAAKGPEVARFLHLVANPNTRAVIEEKLSLPSSSSAAAAAAGGGNSNSSSAAAGSNAPATAAVGGTSTDPTKPGKGPLPSRKRKEAS